MRFVRVVFILCLTVGLGATAQTASSGGQSVSAEAPSSATWSNWRLSRHERASFRVAQIVDGINDQLGLVVLEGGAADGLLRGATLVTHRLAAAAAAAVATGKPALDPAASLWVETGRLKVVEVQERQAIAELVADGSGRSAVFFPRFPGVMVGDVALAPQLTIARRQVSTPTTSLRYDELFEDPKRTPRSFELKKSGVQALRQAAAVFAGARLSLLMVEGYTDQEGRAELNQVESYQRAMTVRQYLVDELGFDERRVVAVGYGEAEPVDGSMAPGQKEANRRIVFKAVSQPTAARP